MGRPKRKDGLLCGEVVSSLGEAITDEPTNENHHHHHHHHHHHLKTNVDPLTALPHSFPLSDQSINQIITAPNHSNLQVELQQVVMADIVSSSTQPSNTICSHCERGIPVANIDLHFAHCSRNLEKCKVCSEMIPIKFADEHFMNTHAPVECALCSETMEREILPVHKGENCPRRITTCEFCEFPLPAVDLIVHQEVCGNRTELCHLCNKYIRLRERNNHEIRCTGVPETMVEPARRENRPVERERGAPPRRQPNEFSTGRLLFTITITGIAVLIGSMFFQRMGQI